MSKERELLKRVRDTLLELKETHYDLYWDIQTALDHPSLDLREPLNDGEITTNTPKTIPIGERLAFHAGIRWAEHQHGIGGEE